MGELGVVERARCELVNFDVVGVESGERSPGSCRLYRCPVCGPRKTSAYFQLAAGSHPDRLVTLTLAPPDFRRCRQQVNDFVKRIRSAGYRWWWFWVIEANPRGTGFHIHGLQHGDYVPQHFLQLAWSNRIVHITRIRVEVEAAKYVLKGAESTSTYLAKGTTGTQDNYYRHLARNGHRAAHWSRGYLRLDGSEPTTAAAMRMAWLGPKDERWAMAGRKETHASVRARVKYSEWVQAEQLRVYAAGA